MLCVLHGPLLPIPSFSRSPSSARSRTLERFRFFHVYANPSEVFSQVFETFGGVAFAKTCGLHLGRRRDAQQLSEARRTCRIMWRFVVNLIGSLALSHMKYRVPPQTFVVLGGDPQEQSVIDELARMKLQFEAVERLEQQSLESTVAASFVRDMEWPAEQWARENMIFLLEGSWAVIPSWLRKQCREYGCAHNTTLQVENTIRVCRDKASGNPANRLEQKACWHSMVYGQSLHQDYGRPPLPVTGAAAAASTKRVPEFLFDHAKDPAALTITEEDFKHLSSKAADWPTLGPYNKRANSLMTFAAVAAGGDYAEIDGYWKSLLLSPGMGVKRPNEPAFLVIETTPHGFLKIRLPLVEEAGVKALDLAAPGPCNVVFDAVSDVDGLELIEFSALPPGDPESVLMARCPCIRVVQLPGRRSLLKTAVLRGLRNLKTYYLKKLFDDELKIEYERGHKPRSERALLRAIAEHILGDGFTEAIWKSICEQRWPDKTDEDDVSANSPVLDENLFDSGDEEDHDEDFEAEVKEFYRKERARQQKNLAKRAAAMRQPAASGQRPTNVDVFTPAVKEKLPDFTGGLTQRAAKRFLPPGYTLTKAVTNDSRWRVRGPNLTEKQKVYQRDDPHSDGRTLLYVLQVAWSAFKRAGGSECPFDLDDWPGLNLQEPLVPTAS